jgi:hypothetical protein
MQTHSMTHVCVCLHVRMHIYTHTYSTLFINKNLFAQLHGKLVISHIFQYAASIS